jgi:hypothetical protein
VPTQPDPQVPDLPGYLDPDYRGPGSDFLPVNTESFLRTLGEELAVRLAEHDANAAENQAERASKNTAALVGALPILATAVSLIAGFFTGHPIHVGAGIGIAVGIALFEVTFGLAVWNMGSTLPMNPQPHHSGWLGIYPHDRGHAPSIRQHYLTLAQDPVTAFGREAIDIGHVAHRKHRRVRVIRLLTLALLVEVTVTFALVWAGV